MAWRRKQNLHFGHWYVTHFHFSPFRLHPKISYDLEWVVTGWTETGCDLWWDSKRKWKWYRLFHFREEVRSDDFFWNRMAFMYCLKQVFHLVTVSFYTEFTSLTEMFSWHWSIKPLGNQAFLSENKIQKLVKAADFADRIGESAGAQYRCLSLKKEDIFNCFV